MITASVVTYKTDREDLEKVVRSALADSVDLLYVIDHSPDDRIKGYLPADPRIVYEKRRNLGFGAGHNAAMAKAMEAGADYHAVLNPDIYWEGKVVAVLADFMKRNPKAGMAVPKVLYPDGRLQYICKRIPTPLDLIANRFLPKNWVKGRVARFRLESTGYDKQMNVPYMHGCFFLLRTDALREVGLFDERFFMYPEDIDLTRRIHEKWDTIFYPFVSIFHAHAAESRKSLKMLRIHIYNMIKYFNKWGWFSDPKRRYYNKILSTHCKELAVKGKC